jgi:2-oxoglutarate dehydrogenase E2 component (dihydrolipoamide succinyltransferase)
MTQQENAPLSPENAFNNVQQIVRKCKDPALSMEQGDILRESLEIIAKRIVAARDLEPKVKELEDKIAELEAKNAELEAKAATATAIPAGYALTPIASLPAAPAAPAAAPAPVAAPAAPLSLVGPNGAQS